MLFGKNVCRERNEKGMSQNDLAATCGFEKTTISRIENGRTNCTIKTATTLAQALGISTSKLFNDLI
ncbi:hypothetical protein AFM12_05610 [Jiulongibacter sediminis]|uniref:HTH cro/C1-type domain-containing protein n=1 Tax=Jiulongibacter sediminis TaxID=1605367 RepID=A0A0N8HAH4_9BACT|nr:hypothetical protein AFM12_05610 [Jiulongibacter sediminis]TBX27198.1 hypothetical protein TK44_05615 [Jiulongibacter sediminis]